MIFSFREESIRQKSNRSRSLSHTGRIFNEMKRELSFIPAQRFRRKTFIMLDGLRKALPGLDAETMDAALTPWHVILPMIPFAALGCGIKAFYASSPGALGREPGKRYGGTHTRGCKKRRHSKIGSVRGTTKIVWGVAQPVLDSTISIAIIDFFTSLRPN